MKIKMKFWAAVSALTLLTAGCGSEGKELFESTTELVSETEAETTTDEAPSAAEALMTVPTTEATVPETEPETAAPSTSEPERIPEDNELVRILDYIPDAVIDLRYATTNNFTGVQIYEDDEAYLCYGTVKKLIKVQEQLRERGYCMLIWDAYRPVEAQEKLWEVYPDPTYVANPAKGITSHSRGNTIDISIVTLENEPMEMPSEFDEFSLIADRDYSDVSKEAAENSRMLEEIMNNNGFTGYWGEWWDYSDVIDYSPIQ